MHLYLPAIHADGFAAQSDPVATFIDAWMQALAENAANMREDDRLTRAAQLHAGYLHGRTPEQMQQSPHIGEGGSFANQRLRAQGYRLPVFWPSDINSVESALTGRDDPSEALRLLLASPSHRTHLLCEGWFADHCVYGIGYVSGHWVVESAPPEE